MEKSVAYENSHYRIVAFVFREKRKVNLDFRLLSVVVKGELQKWEEERWRLECPGELVHSFYEMVEKSIGTRIIKLLLPFAARR